MGTDSSLHALRDASPRNQPGFDEWIDSFDSLRTQIPATPVPAQRPLPKPDSRHRRVVGLAITVATAVVGVAVGLALTAASPPSADAAAKRALAATAAAPSGTMTTTMLHGGVTNTLEATRWNGSDLAFSPDVSDVAVSSIRQLLLIGGGAYVQTSDGTWLHYVNASDVPPKPLGGMVQYAQDNIAGTTAQQILALATGVQKTAQSDGTTVYTGTIPISTAGAGIAPSDGGAIMGMILGVVKGKERAAPGGGLHNDLQLQMSVGGDGLVRQVSVTFQQEDTGTPAVDGTYTASITYSQLGSTPPITSPASSTDVPPGTLPQSGQTQNVQTPPNKPFSK